MTKPLTILITLATLLPVMVTAQTQIRFYTTMGEFTVEMYDSITPITSGNFIDLVDSGFYDGVIFHRVIDNFMIQGGDPTGTGFGGPGYTIPDEFDSTLSNVQKTISMANSGPNTGGSQFFINLVNNTYLDFDKPPYTSAHPVFGIVTEGFDIVQDIGDVATNANDRPLTDVVMDSLRVIIPEDTTTPTGIAGPAGQESSVRVYPNPVTRRSVIVLENQQAKQVHMAVYDQSGRLMHRSTEMLREGQNTIPLGEKGLTALPAGVYYLVADDGGAGARTRFVVLEN